jgi:hypothetical protein
VTHYELMENEKWKIIKSKPNYEVSNSGLVRHAKTKRPLKIYTTSQDNQYISDVGLRIYIERLVAAHFLEPLDAHHVIEHLDGNRLNNHVSNLIRIASGFAV